MQNSHGHTHGAYTLEILDLFSVDRHTPAPPHGNTMLLWHGSRLANWAGILGQVGLYLLIE